ncbi:LLM class F420-dependent oxidoreductase [Parahaliea maris]|uniref:LLM class F420-dependent oxidoreductase n=1 Tax=Parahaliea maris TaxID=2716870 RepID=A0A5C9A663_9GAMM|nr:LLM class F420-dependent oxidoreductase [Parahaliea maris]TXS95260.1 LLM class F420-dependent oxidoreductase [Parahaliea maris]
MHLGFSSMNTADDPAPDLLARTLEQAGFESLWYGEHSHIPVSRRTPYPAGDELPEPYKKMMDPYVSLMAAAAATDTLKLGTGIALLMERELFSQAKTIGTLDRLSGGRVLIGCGVGWNEEEFENATSLPWKKRYSALRETVAAQRALFNEAEPTYHGELIDFDPVWFEPKPLQVGGPPIIFGAMGPLGVRHAAEWADGWMPVDVAMPDVKQGIADFRAAVSAAGRDPDKVEITLVVMSPVTADLLKSYRDMGVHRCNIGVGVENWDRPEVIMPMIDEFARLIPEL